MAQRTKTRGNGTGCAYKRGHTWTAKVILGYTPEHKAIARTKGGFRTKAEALAYCATLKSPDVLPPSISFGEVYADWAAAYESRVAPSTMACYKAAYKWYEDVTWRPIAELTTRELQACIDRCPRGRSTLDDMRTVCSLVFRHAQANHLVDGNPAQLLYTARSKKGTRAPFTEKELQRIREAVYVVPWADYVYILCYLGMRPGEMLALKKTSFHKEDQYLVGGNKTAAGIDRIITISPKIQPMLEAQLETPGEWLFPAEDGSRMTDEHFRVHCFQPCMDALGITGKVPYSCRHTFANMLKNVFGSDTDKAALIGHADASMTKYYQSADFASLRAITNQI